MCVTFDIQSAVLSKLFLTRVGSWILYQPILMGKRGHPFAVLIVTAHSYYSGIVHGGKSSCITIKDFVIAMIARKNSIETIIIES